MLAVDTNVIVRLLTDDHPEQSQAARAIFAAEPILLLTTVALETEWVLRSGYGYGRRDVLVALERLLGFAGVQAEEPERISRALALFGAGMDFADALHIVGADLGGATLATFDRKLGRQAHDAGLATRIVV